MSSTFLVHVLFAAVECGCWGDNLSYLASLASIVYSSNTVASYALCLFIWDFSCKLKMMHSLFFNLCAALACHRTEGIYGRRNCLTCAVCILPMKSLRSFSVCIPLQIVFSCCMHVDVYYSNIF